MGYYRIEMSQHNIQQKMKKEKKNLLPVGVNSEAHLPYFSSWIRIQLMKFYSNYEKITLKAENIVWTFLF